jgi:beta-phosphoglucomutase-like phosphatase (HAD superfamily)
VFLRRLEHACIPFAIASSTSRENIDTVLAILGWEARFQAIVSARDVTRGKPDPEVFLKAAHLLEVSPAQCVVFEDAFVGLIAARAARMKCIGVATTHSAERLRLMADRVVHTLDAVTVEDLETMVGGGLRAVVS